MLDKFGYPKIASPTSKHERLMDYARGGKSGARVKSGAKKTKTARLKKGGT